LAKPVIGYNNGGTHEIIKDEVAGLYYIMEDIKVLQTAWQDL